jgi:hypothetical protein
MASYDPLHFLCSKQVWELSSRVRLTQSVSWFIGHLPGDQILTLYLNAPTRTRTWDPRLKRPVLYQLSYESVE